METKTVAIIALGANLGSPARTIARAIARLQDFSDHPLERSSLWQTKPVDCPPGSPDFVNAVVTMVPRASETPESLLAKLLSLEKEFGRQSKRAVNEPRPLDLDLIAFGEEVRRTKDLTLPHPRAAYRRFVLAPLSELIPELVLPGQSSTVSGLLSRLPRELGMRKLDPREL